MHEEESGGLRAWLLPAARAAFMLDPGPLRQGATVGLLLAVLAATSVVHVVAARFEVDGPAAFNYLIWIAGWWTAGLLVLASWSLAETQKEVPQPGLVRPLASWLVLWNLASVPIGLASATLSALGQHGIWSVPETAEWALIAAFYAWAAAVSFRSSRMLLTPRRAAALAVLVLCVDFVSSALYPQRFWYATTQAAAPEQPAAWRLTQETFEQQQTAAVQAMQGLQPQRAGVVDVYGIVFAPFASEDVFLRESTMVASVLADRFDATGRVVHLVNHATTAATHPWATPQNLKRAIDAVSERMDRDEDVLVVYLTSHGASNFRLAADHAPLDVDGVTPQLLRQLLNESGVRHRVVAISACYSGGWVPLLEDDRSLVMTAADATHTSYGCGRKSELTFFGRAVFAEQLRSKTRSFEEAFNAAVPVIRQREQEAGKDDGFSNPQIAVGAAIRPVLQALERRLEKP